MEFLSGDLAAQRWARAHQLERTEAVYLTSPLRVAYAALRSPPASSSRPIARWADRQVAAPASCRLEPPTAPSRTCTASQSRGRRNPWGIRAALDALSVRWSRPRYSRRCRY